MISFWIFFSFLGFLLPLALLIISLILPRSKKLGYPKYWYLLSVISGLWILTAAVLTVLLITSHVTMIS